MYNNPIINNTIKFFKTHIPIIEIAIPIISNIIPNTHKRFPLRQLSVIIPEEISRAVVINKGTPINITMIIAKPDANAKAIPPITLDTSVGLEIEFNMYIIEIELPINNKLPNIIENHELIL